MSSPKRPGRGRVPVLTSRAKIDVTIAHLQGRTPQDIAAERSVSPATVTRAVREVLAAGAVRFVPDYDRIAPPQLDADLAQRLLNKYPDQLQRVFVLKVPSADEWEDDDASYCNEVHRRLGRQMAEHVRHVIQSGDTIGVSSGRGVYHTIDSLYGSPEPPIQANDVSLTSLTGSFGRRPSSADPTIMDGDANVGLLCQAFGRMVHMHTVGRELVKSRGATSTPPWIEATPNRVLIGVGLLEDGNQLLSGAPVLREVSDDLAALAALARVHATDTYVPVADTCNHLFFVDPPPGHGMSPSEAEAIRAQIKALNTRLLAIPLVDLGKTESVWLVAGTERKACAVHSILRQLRIGAMCVDDKLARFLLDLPQRDEGER